jgi:hypothetical protein
MVDMMVLARLLGRLQNTPAISRPNAGNTFGRFGKGYTFHPTALAVIHSEVHSSRKPGHRGTEEETQICVAKELYISPEGVRHLLNEINDSTFGNRPRMAIELLVRLVHQQMSEQEAAKVKGRVRD